MEVLLVSLLKYLIKLWNMLKRVKKLQLPKRMSP